MERKEDPIPVPTNKDGSVQPKRRAAVMKRAISAHTQENTVQVDARWDADKKEWILIFFDES